MASISMAVGAGMLAISGLILGIGAAVYGDWVEAGWCSSFGIGLLMFAFAMLGPGRGRAALSGGGLVLAAVGGTAWAMMAISRGNFPTSWPLLGVGVVVAALAALLHWRLPDARVTLAWSFPVAFGIVFIAGLEMVWSDWGFTVWFLGDALVAVGAALLAFRSGRAFETAMGRGATVGS